MKLAFALARCSKVVIRGSEVRRQVARIGVKSGGGLTQRSSKAGYST
jgi:hypothetical protein